MTQVAPHAWFEPKLAALMAEAATAGIAQDVSVAVITDLVNGKLSAAVPPPETANTDQDIGEPDSAANQVPATPSDDIGLANPVGGALSHVGRRRGLL